MTSIPPPTVPPATPPPPGGGSYTPPPPPPGGGPSLPPPPGGAANSDRTIMLILSYAWLLCLIPLFTKKDDPEVQWHAKNGLVMAVVITVIDILFYILGRFFPLFTCLVSFVPCGLFIAYVVVSIIAMVKAINGQRLRIPMLTDQAEKLNF
jgi:uncharacterized membrane protein